MMATIEHMTLESLKQFIDDAIDERLTKMLGNFELNDAEDDQLTWDEIRHSVEANR